MSRRDMLLFLVFLLAASATADYGSERDGKDELKSHFGVGDATLESVEDILLKMKKLAHQRAYNGHDFGHDAELAKDKEITISTDQPKVEKSLQPYLFEGDIFLSRKQAINILKQLSYTEGNRRSRRGRRGGFVSDVEAQWLDTPIRYKFHESLDFYAISQIIAGIRYWENNTCLSFENSPNVDDEDDHVEFFQGQGCYSMIGRNGGRQGVSIGDTCLKLGVIEHEIGHVLGLWHEQSRPDALSFVKIFQDFIIPTYISDFQQRDKEIDVLGLPYDLGSVMHYGSIAFSADMASKTLLTRDPIYQRTIGQRESLSFFDILTINSAYCKGNCDRGAAKCENGGYPHPKQCSKCLCPSGLGGSTCNQHEEPEKATCGGTLTVTDSWTNLKSPGYPDEDFEPGQKCSWLINAPVGERIELEFIGDFEFLCTSTCLDYVEVKLTKDLRNTGFRLCCAEDKPKVPLVSEANRIIVIFKATISGSVGFEARARKTNLPARTTPAPVMRTTTPTPTTISGHNIWADWGEWSQCSRSCGGCGIQSRLRLCKTKDCDGKRQEFSTCNMNACPVDRHCASLTANRLCNGKVCSELQKALAGCDQPLCCPPFYNQNGVCQSDSPISSDFVS